MNITEIVVGDRVIVQLTSSVSEVAKVKGINVNDNIVIIMLSNYNIVGINPKHILKSFGQ